MSSPLGRNSLRYLAAVLVASIVSTPLACALDWDDRGGSTSTGGASGGAEQALQCTSGQGMCTCAGTLPCKVDCAGGGCNIDCNGAPSCTVACPGSSCTTFCKTASTCTATCGQSCTMNCENPGKCTQSCDISAGCTCSGC
jgi:hypothetical protein